MTSGPTSTATGWRAVAAGWRAALAGIEQSPWALAIPVAAAAVLGVVTIGDKSIWLDEAFSVAAARLPLPDLLNYLWHNELNASPYYVLLHFWLALGTGEAQVRALSVVLGIGAVVGTYAVGRRFGVAFRAALIVAVLPAFVQYEQEARTYALLAAWAAITTLAYLRYREQPSRLRLVVYALVGGLMIYVHPIGALVVVAHAIHAAFKSAPPDRLGLLAAFGAIFIAWLPMLRFALLHHDKISWIPPLSVTSMSAQFTVLSGGMLLGGVLLIVVALGVRRDLPSLWLAIPIVGILLISALVQPTLQGRYLTCVLPAIAIIAARTRARAIAVVIVVSVIATSSWYVDGHKDDWRSAVAWVSATAQPGDGILFSPGYGRLPFEYYGKVGQPIYPTVGWDQTYLPGYGAFPEPPASITYDRVWLVKIFGTPAPAAVLALVDGYRPAEERSYGANGPDITLLVRSP